MRFTLAEDEDEESAATSRRKRNATGNDTGIANSGVGEASQRRRTEAASGPPEEELRNSDGINDDGGGGSGGRVPVIIDTDALDCSVCFEPLRPPIYQCQNGHVACISCCTKLRNRCHVCSLFIGDIRCLSLEKVIGSILISCSHARYGCKETVLYTQRESHKEKCVYAPCGCPISHCQFQGPNRELSKHLKSQHSCYFNCFEYSKVLKLSIQKMEPFLVLCGQDEQVFLFLNDNGVSCGNAFSMTSVQSGSLQHNFSYELKVTNKGNSILQLKASMPHTSSWNGKYPVDTFLLVPSNFSAPSQEIQIDVLVQRTVNPLVK